SPHRSIFATKLNFGRLGNLDREFLSVVGYLLIKRIRTPFTNSVAFANDDYAKSSLFQHSWESALAGSDRQHAGSVVPAHGDYRVLTTLVGISIPRIFVKIELAIRSLVNTEFNWAGGILICVFNVRPKREDRSRTHIQWHAVNRSIGIDLLAT